MENDKEIIWRLGLLYTTYTRVSIVKHIIYSILYAKDSEFLFRFSKPSFFGINSISYRNICSDFEACNNVFSILEFIKRTNIKDDARLDGVFAFHIFFTRLSLGEQLKEFKIPIKYLPESTRNAFTRAEMYYDYVEDWDEYVNNLNDWMGVKNAESQAGVLIEYLQWRKAKPDMRNIKIKKTYIDASNKSIVIEIKQM